MTNRFAWYLMAALAVCLGSHCAHSFLFPPKVVETPVVVYGANVVVHHPSNKILGVELIVNSKGGEQVFRVRHVGVVHQELENAWGKE